jgi:REP element-mobilizing transposase RayT
LTEYGKIVERIIDHIPEHLKVSVDNYIIMPNHIHMILVITNDEEIRAIRESPLRGRSVISKAVGYIKMNASKEIHNRFGNEIIWQRSFHDHVIRDRQDYETIANYIYENPRLWQDDCFYVSS